MTQHVGAADGGKKIWVTLRGLPLSIRLDWPFHPSGSGADFWVLHGEIQLASDETRSALVSVNMSRTVKDVMPSLEAKDAENPVINALRKDVDKRQIEFVKSGKLLPVNFSSRHYDFKRNKWVFGKATDEAIAELLERKVYWQTKLGGSKGVRIADPAEAQYMETTPEHLIEVAARLVAADGLIRLDGEWAEPGPGLPARAGKIEAAMKQALEELEQKHAFERG
jgi:hypothetical protein